MIEINLAANLCITLTFSEADLIWIRAEKIAIPSFWTGHAVAPQVGDLLRFGGCQFEIGARVWESTANKAVLVLYMRDRQPEARPILH